MRRLRRILPWVLLVVLALAGLGLRCDVPPKASAAAPAESQPNAFFDAAQFSKGLRQAQVLPPPPSDRPLIGGLVPHHILVGYLFSTFFLDLQRHPPKTVILVGPNHPNHGQRIITGRRGWSTDFGVVQADQALVNRLVQAGLAVVDDDTLANEHSIGAIIPYLKYHVPNARVVPLILHRDVSIQEVGRLADELAPLLGDERVLVASMDFSHYLTRPEAEARDVETWAAFQAGDLPALWRMGPEHLDSPPSVGLLMLTMQRVAAGEPEVAGHTNSGVIIGSDQIETTSYFTLKYRQPKK